VLHQAPASRRSPTSGSPWLIASPWKEGETCAGVRLARFPRQRADRSAQGHDVTSALIDVRMRPLGARPGCAGHGPASGTSCQQMDCCARRAGVESDGQQSDAGSGSMPPKRKAQRGGCASEGPWVLGGRGQRPGQRVPVRTQFPPATARRTGTTGRSIPARGDELVGLKVLGAGWEFVADQ